MNMTSQCGRQSTFFDASRLAYKKQDDRVRANKITSCVEDGNQNKLEAAWILGPSLIYTWPLFRFHPFFWSLLSQKRRSIIRKAHHQSACKGIHSL